VKFHMPTNTAGINGLPIVDDDQVKLAFFTDPDGNDLYLCEVKKW